MKLVVTHPGDPSAARTTPADKLATQLAVQHTHPTNTPSSELASVGSSQLNGLSDNASISDELPTPSEALDVFIASAGISALTCERLSKRYPAIDEVKLFALLTNPGIAAELEQKTRAQLTLATYQAATEALTAAKLAIGQMEPFEKSKAATNFLQQLNELTKKPQDININNIIWEHYLPAEAAAAVRYLASSNQPVAPDSSNSIIEHDSND